MNRNMKKRLLAGIVLLMAFVVPLATAQGPNEGFISESEGTSHLIKHPDPIYPPIAKAVHVQGSVLLHATVDTTGAVTKIEIVGGHPMLRGAAEDAVKHWIYRPFEVNGKPAVVQVIVSVPFSLGIPSAQEKSDEAIGQAFFPKADECEAANHAGHWTDAAKLCGDLATIAQRFPDPSSRWLEILDAHQDYGEALAFSGSVPEALIQFHQAVDIAQKRLTNKNAEYGTAFYWLAYAEHVSHMPAEADQDYATAELAYRNAIADLPDMKKIYSRYLAHTLAFHSVLENQTGHADEAKAMRAEALSLDPHSLDRYPKGD
jgi:TonB family protein